jgi:putative FmdB family regulatory protein
MAPTFHYKCACGHEEDRVYSMKMKPQTIKCPKCNADAPSLIRGTSFSLVGDGWPSKEYKETK